MSHSDRVQTFDEIAGEETSGDVDVTSQAQERYLRTLADFDNYRKRVERERDEIGVAAKRDLLLGLLDLADSFERAVASAAGSDGEDPLAAGFLAIYRQLQRLLASHGVTTFESAGEPFDPERHEAVGVVDADDVPEGHVARELGRGYLWNGRLLRPARVQVAQ
jgi:molecular chaperone GrpE